MMREPMQQQKPENEVSKYPICSACYKNGAICTEAAQPNGRCPRHGGASTGPRSTPGRRTASMNALKSGLYNAHAMTFRRLLSEYKRIAKDYERSVTSILNFL